MKRCVTWTVLISLMFSQGITSQCLAADAELRAHMAAYRTNVLAKAAPPVSQPQGLPGATGRLWSQVIPLLLAADAEPVEGDQSPYVHWSQRRGPAYSTDKWRSFGRDVQELPLTVWDDLKYSFTDPVFLGGMLAAGAAGIAINATGGDDAVARRTDGHRQLCKELDGIGGFFGSPAFHFPLAALMYGTGLVTEDAKLYETSKTLINALILNGVSNVLLKIACRTESPNDDENGWPSGHTSSTFTVATVMYEAYGPWIGAPLFAFAAFVGYERIDARNHDFSDVVSGMVMGIVWGYAVSKNHKPQIFGMDLEPFVDPATNAVGVSLTKRW